MKKRIIAVAITVIMICSGLSSMSQTADNTLTANDKKQGWKLLFDGAGTKGWRPYNNAASDGWLVKNGELVNKKDDVKNRTDLITADQYDDFEFSIDWKLEKGANSGIVYRCLETKGASYETGPEYQLIDDNGYYHALEDWQKSGSNYAMHPPKKLVAKPVGEWNTTRIVVKGAHVQHWLNNELVVEYDFWTPEWVELKTKGKWKDTKDYGLAKKGYIALQDHGGGISFKNIKIRKPE